MSLEFEFESLSVFRYMVPVKNWYDPSHFTQSGIFDQQHLSGLPP